MRARKYNWEVWDDCRVRYFPTIDAAERWAHKFVAENQRGAEICHRMHTVAQVRLDGAGRVWTAVVDCEMA